MTAAYETSIRGRLVRLLDSPSFLITRRRGGIRVRWFEAWVPELEDALLQLPQPHPYSRETYRLLCEGPFERDHRIALVEDRGGPMAVVGIARAASLAWEVVTSEVLPGDPFPMRAGSFEPAARALGVELACSLWDSAIDPDHVGADVVVRKTSHRARAGEIRENWSKKHRRTLKQAQTRCAGFRLEVNAPEGANWVPRKFYEKWDMSQVGFAGYVRFCQHLLDRGELQVIRLFDDQKPIGGQVSVVMGGTMYMIEIHREDGYEWHGLGNRLIEITVESGIERGDVEWFDFDADHSYYKTKWAPEGGSVDYLCFRPRRIKAVRKLAALINR